MLFLMKIVKFSASIMTGLWGENKKVLAFGDEEREKTHRAFAPGNTFPGGRLPPGTWSWPLWGLRARGGEWQVR